MKTRTVRLGDVADFLTGFPFKSREYSRDGSGMRLLRGDNIGQGFLRWDGAKFWPYHSAGDYGKFELKPGDVVLAMDRPWIEAGLKYSVVNDADLPALLVQRVTRLRGTESLDTGYLRYLIGSREFTEHVHTVSTGTAVPHISGRDILAFEFELPEVEVQKEIARTLGALDDKIELNRRMSATLEEMARALYRSWFVDFDPVHARALGQPPAHMDPATATLFPDSFAPDGLPKGWEAGTLVNVAQLNPEKWSKRSHPDSIRYLDLANVKWGGIESVSEYGWDEAPSRARMVLQKGDTIVGTVRPGNGSYAMIHSPGLTGSTGFAVLRANDENNSAFLYCAATSPENIERLTNLADGAAYPAVRSDIVGATSIIVPPDTVFRAYSASASVWLARCGTLANEVQTLAALRDTLLPRLMSGDLRIRKAEKQVEEVV